MELHRLIPHSLLKKDHDEARELTRQVLASKPDSYEAHWAHLLRGRIELQALGNLEAAEDHLKKAADWRGRRPVRLPGWGVYMRFRRNGAK